jgi:uncharacterized membrane protein YpjA
MNRKFFLTFAGVIALMVGTTALSMPWVLLESKGVTANPAAEVWMRELGISILALAVVMLWVRGHADSSTLRAFLFGNAVLQLGLLPIELAAHADGVLTKISGVVPNSVLHVVLAFGFIWYAWRMQTRPARP